MAISTTSFESNSSLKITDSSKNDNLYINLNINNNSSIECNELKNIVFENNNKSSLLCFNKNRCLKDNKSLNLNKKRMKIKSLNLNYKQILSPKRFNLDNNICNINKINGIVEDNANNLPINDNSTNYYSSNSKENSPFSYFSLSNTNNIDNLPFKVEMSNINNINNFSTFKSNINYNYKLLNKDNCKFKLYTNQNFNKDLDIKSNNNNNIIHKFISNNDKGDEFDFKTNTNNINKLYSKYINYSPTKSNFYKKNISKKSYKKKSNYYNIDKYSDYIKKAEKLDICAKNIEFLNKNSIEFKKNIDDGFDLVKFFLNK